MSCWMISDAHADFLATAYLQFIDGDADPQAIGAALLTENARSIRVRYEERHGMAEQGDTQAAAYRYRPWRGNINPDDLHVQALCANYQCSEDHCWPSTDSAKQIAQLVEATGGWEREMPDGYDWGVDWHPEDKAPAIAALTALEGARAVCVESEQAGKVNLVAIGGDWQKRGCFTLERPLLGRLLDGMEIVSASELRKRQRTAPVLGQLKLQLTF